MDRRSNSNEQIVTNLNRLLGYEYDSTFGPNSNLKQRILSNDSGISNKTTWYYSDVVTSSPGNISTTELNVFPNPATGYITFDIEDDSQPASVELINMQGKKVIFQILPQGK